MQAEHGFGKHTLLGLYVTGKRNASGIVMPVLRLGFFFYALKRTRAGMMTVPEPYGFIRERSSFPFFFAKKHGGNAGFSGYIQTKLFNQRKRGNK